MGRAVRRVPLTLILGAAVTLAIAWGLPRLPWRHELRISPGFERAEGVKSPPWVTGGPEAIHWMYEGVATERNQQAWLDRVSLRPLESTMLRSYPLRARAVWYVGWSRCEIIECQEIAEGQQASFTVTGPPPTAAVITSAGWPLECLSCIQWRERAAPAFDSWTPEWRLRGGFSLGPSAASPTFTNGVADPPPVLPFTVAPGAFLIDSIVNGAIVAVLFAAFGAVCRRVLAAWRTNRRRCPSCGYPTGAAAACTECGANLKPAA